MEKEDTIIINKHINILNSSSHQQNKDLNHREIPLYTHKVAKIEKIGVMQYQQMWSYWNSSFADRRIRGTAILEKSLALPHKVSHTQTPSDQHLHYSVFT